MTPEYITQRLQEIPGEIDRDNVLVDFHVSLGFERDAEFTRDRITALERERTRLEATLERIIR